MEEHTHLDIVDLDESCANRLVNESIVKKKSFIKCPHHIVKKVIQIIGDQIGRENRQEDPPALQKANDNFDMLDAKTDKIINMISEMKEQIHQMKTSKP